MKMYSAPKLPSNIKSMVSKLKIGEIQAIYGVSLDETAPVSSFVLFLIKDTDEKIISLTKTPTIEAIAGSILVHLDHYRIWCVPTLFRFNKNPNMTYQLDYNLIQPDALSTYTAFGKMPSFDFLFCGETQEKIITVKLDVFTQHVTENIKLAKEQTDMSWNDDAYHKAIKIIHEASDNQLWEILEENNGLVELSKN